MKLYMLSWLGVMALLLAACGPAATAIPSPTTPPVATAPTKATATPALVATATAVPTAAPSPAPKTTAATAGPKYGGILRHRMLDDVEGWDPGRAYWRIGEVSLWTYPRLFSFNRGQFGGPKCELFPIEPELATGFKWVDDRTLNVAIRQGVRLPQKPPLNGRELTADDVVFTYNRIMFTVQVPLLQVLAKNTAEVSKLDRYTVRFKLKSPSVEYPAVALSYFNSPILLPETITPVGDPSGRYTFEGFQTGAYGRFRPVRHMPGVGVDLERNPDFFLKSLPYLDGASLRVLTEESTFLAAVRSGRLDSGVTRSSVLIADVAKRGDVPAEICPAAHVPLAFMNMNRPEFKDVNTRRAISMAMDRETLKKVVFSGYGSGGYSIMTPALGPAWTMELKDYPPEVRRWLTYDVKAAKELLARSAYPDGFTSKVAFATTQAGMREMSEGIGSMLDDIGIVLKMDGMPFPDYNAMLADYPWDKPTTRHTGVLMGLIAWVYADDIASYTASGSSLNRSVMADPKLDKMLDEQRRIQDPAKRQQYMRDIQVYLVDNMYILPLPSGPNAELHQPNVKGIYFKTYGSQDGDAMRDVWLDK